MKCKYMVDQIKDFKILTHSLSDIAGSWAATTANFIQK